MQVSACSKDDVKLMAQVVNLLTAGEFSLGGKDLCAAADAIRWLQKLAVQCSESYQAGVHGTPTPPPPPTEETKPSLKDRQPGAFSQAKIKSFHPGKAK